MLEPYTSILLIYILVHPVQKYWVTTRNQTILELSIQAHPNPSRWERENKVTEFHIQCNFSRHGAVDARAPNMTHLCVMASQLECFGVVFTLISTLDSMMRFLVGIQFSGGFILLTNRKYC